MPVVAMQKVLIAGHRQSKENILKTLQEAGIIELSALPYESIEEKRSDNNDFILAEIANAIMFIEKRSGIKKSFISSFAPDKETIDHETMLSTEKEFDWISAINKVKEIENHLLNIGNLEIKMLNELETLTPWKTLPFKLNFEKQLPHISIIFGRCSVKNSQALAVGLPKSFPTVEIEVISSNDNDAFVAIYCLTEKQKEILEALNKFSFSTTTLPQSENTAKQEIEQIRKTLSNIRSDKMDSTKEILGFTKDIRQLQIIYDHYSILKQEKDTAKKLTNTKHSFIVSGWVKKKNITNLQKLLLKGSASAELVLINPEKNEKVPTAIENIPIFRPFELITKTFGIPGQQEIDPTGYLSFFYMLFFGICLSDVFYGLILSIVSIYFLKRLTLSEGGKNLLLLLFWGGIFSMFIGVLTGGYFAIDMNTIAPNPVKSVLMSLKVIDPIKSPLNLLIISLSLGVIQIMWGLAVGMYWKIKNNHLIDGIFDYGLWIFFLSSLIFLLVTNFALPQFISLASNMSIVGAIMLFLTQGRGQPTLLGKGIFGLLSLYRTTSFLGDILSYSRLLALLMTTSIIGMVVNIIALLTRDSIPILGYVIMFAILLVGHTFNLIVSVLGAFIHSMRLQLVEFFGKFYEGTGRNFKPFTRNTKYIIVK